jgi:hypothetical protein
MFQGCCIYVLVKQHAAAAWAAFTACLSSSAVLVSPAVRTSLLSGQLCLTGDQQIGVTYLMQPKTIDYQNNRSYRAGSTADQCQICTVPVVLGQLVLLLFIRSLRA